MGATGNTGKAITLALLRDGHRVRALGRSEQRLADLAAAGAETLAGDPADPAFLTGAFSGADAVYTLLPTDPTRPDVTAQVARLGAAIVTAAAAAEVPYLVALSSLGAESEADTGFITTLHAQEARLRTLTGTNVLFLRPGLFFESFHPALEVIQQAGVNADVVDPDVPVPMVATRDVAAVAAAALSARDWTGVAVREVLGPRDLTYAEVTTIIGDRIGRPDLPYVRLPEAELAGMLAGAGMSEEAADLHVRMGRALSDGTVRSRGRTPESTTPTRFEDFAEELAQAYVAGSALPGPAH